MTDVSEPVQAASTSTPNDSFIIPKRARRPTSRSRSSSRSSDPDSRQRGSGDAEGEKRSKSRRRRRAPKRGGDHVSKRRRRSRSRSLSRSRNRTTSASDGSELSRVFRRDLSREVVKIVLLGASMERYFRELRALLDREGISHSNRYLNNQAIKDVIRDTGEQGIDYIMILGNENEKNRNVSLKIISDPGRFLLSSSTIFS